VPEVDRLGAHPLTIARHPRDYFILGRRRNTEPCFGIYMIAKWATTVSRLAAVTEVEMASRDEPTSSSPKVAGIAISIEDDAPPVVRAIARDLAACLEDSSFADATRRTRGVVSVRSASTPQSVTLRVARGAVSLAHGAADDAEVTATAELGGSVDAEPVIETSGARSELAEWLSRLLHPPVPPWTEAAARFWSVLSAMPGAPTALLVVALDDGERRFGSAHGQACEIHGSINGLLAVLTGRSSLMEAAFDATVYVRGSFPDLSVLSGAGFEIRFGGVPADG
jgi:hypothetical protein